MNRRYGEAEKYFKQNKRKGSNRLPRWEDLLNYHDLDDNGLIDQVEVMANMEAFSERRGRVLADRKKMQQKMGRQEL